MKVLFTKFALLTGLLVFAQVGIDTETPKSDLHISKTATDSGSIQIDGGIRLGGDQDTQGSKGEAGQVLMSAGPTSPAKWVTLGKAGGYITDCRVPNEIAVINLTGTQSDLFSTLNNADASPIPASSVQDALDALPNGGIIVLRTNERKNYSNSTSYLHIKLPSTSQGIYNKPFIITLDGPEGENNKLQGGQNIVLQLMADDGSKIYEVSGVSGDRKYQHKEFPTRYQIAKLESTSGGGGFNIVLFNSAVISAVNDKTWAIMSPFCTVQNPIEIPATSGNIRN
ncbi:hypothetical protein NMK71_08475 [Weeksellaceae bacterium KMM 9713]|uniref:Uncharacterized protein n=1 Tax=Profundicola chukchiensis TaxID=2961959 RepID=A0A9X4MZF6_9FLAO|nr:hypothetical protein [Profundicola chukchiensis]MDG4946447.1 hypothetical protein [Profundicola chukchiensis]